MEDKIERKQDNEEGTTRRVKKKEESQLLWVFIVVIFVFIGFFAVYYYFQSFNKFQFAGIDFEKIKEGEVVFYYSRFPIIYNGSVTNYYNLYLREDPRKNDIPLDVNFKFWPTVTISTSPEAGTCKGDGVIANGNLAMFLNSLPVTEKINGAVTDAGAAEELNLTFADCSSAEGQTVIMITRTSSEPYIIQNSTNKDCYEINVGECENLKATERFILGVIAQINDMVI